jgi:hypothetical protein
MHGSSLQTHRDAEALGTSRTVQPGHGAPTTTRRRAGDVDPIPNAKLPETHSLQHGDFAESPFGWFDDFNTVLKAFFMPAPRQDEIQPSPITV